MTAVDLTNTSTWQAKGTSSSTGGGTTPDTGTSPDTGTNPDDGTTPDDGNNDGNTITPVDPCADGLGLGCDGTDSSTDEETAAGEGSAPLGLLGLGVLALIGVAVFVMRRREEEIDLTAQDALFDEDDLAEAEAPKEPEEEAVPEAEAEKDVVDIPAPPPPGGPPA